MKIKIAIPKIGFTKGTVGWLLKGLGDGSIKITEGTGKNNGKHGLWISYPDQGSAKGSNCLAIRNQWDFRDGKEYRITYIDPREEARIWTPAAQKALEQVARDWCDKCNVDLENEEVPTIKITRIES